MLRIKFLLTQSLESPSGLGRYAPLAKELVKRSHQVTVLALHPDIKSIANREIALDGVRVLYVAPMHVQKSQYRKSYYPTSNLVVLMAGATVKLTSASLASHADFLHVCKPHPMNSIAGLITRYLHGESLYLDCDDYEAAVGRFSSAWQLRVIAGFEQWMPHRASQITTNTLFMRDKLVSWGIPAERITYLPNGVERLRFQRPKEEQLLSLRSRLTLADRKVIAYVGSLSRPGHPVDLLLEAFRIVLNEYPKAILLLVGGGEDFDYLQKIAHNLGIHESIRFCGRIENNQVSQYYHLADVSVDPVFADDAARGRSPLKLFESWACDVPFVTADVGDRSQLLGIPSAGVLTRAGDAFALAQGILQILRCPALGEEIARLGRERVENYYWDRLVELLESVYIANNKNKR